MAAPQLSVILQVTKEILTDNRISGSFSHNREVIVNKFCN